MTYVKSLILKGSAVPDLRSAAQGGRRVDILIALRDVLVDRMTEATAGVMPQFAKQIADITREIDELTPKEVEVSEVADAANAFAAAITADQSKRAKKS
ncbi:hypothetical protein AB0G00_24055 [Nocardia salmonicida]|uniref:hypothetical protein n=1 Tax=Nocardia salmonicida TaxID=53431 RepID=UPI0034055513